MYYQGTYIEVLGYNALVTKGENYLRGDGWADPIKKHDEELYLIKAHSKYESDLKLIKGMPSDWLKKEEI